MSDKKNESESGGDLTVTIVNENNTKSAEFPAGSGTPVETIIDRMYASPKLGIGEKTGQDRLRCKGSGEDVFQYRQLHLSEFKEKHCAGLQWVFAGPAGGA